MSYYVFCFITVIGSLCLNLAILLTYLKFSNRLEYSLAQRIKYQLGQSPVDSAASQEHSEHQQAQRRLLAYQEIADQQIEQILATMMTISVLRATETSKESAVSKSDLTPNRVSETESITMNLTSSVNDDSNEMFLKAHEKHLSDAMRAISD